MVSTGMQKLIQIARAWTTSDLEAPFLKMSIDQDREIYPIPQWTRQEIITHTRQELIQFHQGALIRQHQEISVTRCLLEDVHLRFRIRKTPRQEVLGIQTQVIVIHFPLPEVIRTCTTPDRVAHLQKQTV